MVAVSGGVDSMVLLQVLAAQPDLELVVAHFDHGIRSDADEDRKLVQGAAEHLHLPFFYAEGRLGPHASEAFARQKRYAFLHGVRKRVGAQAVITAHHQDDLLETAIINMLRGTGRLGLSSLRSRGTVLRPFLHISKEEIRAYARSRGISWREDSTNQDDTYLRNGVRHQLVPLLRPAQREQLLRIIGRVGELNNDIDAGLADLLATQAEPHILNRQFFSMLPHAVAREYLALWLRLHGAAYDRRRIERLVVFVKTAEPGKLADVDAQYLLEASKKDIVLKSRTLAD